MSERLFTVISCSHPWEAYIYKTKLEFEGIKCCIADEYIVIMNWLYSTAVGGVKVKVKESDVDNAIKLLRLGMSEDTKERHRLSCSYYLFVILVLLDRCL